MATPQLDVHYPDGTVQSFPLNEERVVVGKSPKCQVALVDRVDLAPEHLLLSPRPDGCWVAVARGAPTQAMVEGQLFERGMVPWGKAVLVGAMRFVLNDGTKPADGKEKKKQQVNPVLLIVTAVVVPIALYSVFTGPTAAPPARVSTPPPALFDSLNRPCPQSDPGQIVGTAQELARIALSKAERMPFRTQDGVEAVGYYAQAAACYRTAGDPALSTIAMRKATELQAHLEDEYRAHRFRLERALEQERYEDGLYEVRMLTALVSHRPGPYLQALHSLERQLSLRIDTAAAAAH